MDDVIDNVENLIIELSKDESTKKDVQKLEAFTHLISCYSCLVETCSVGS